MNKKELIQKIGKIIPDDASPERLIQVHRFIEAIFIKKSLEEDTAIIKPNQLQEARWKRRLMYNYKYRYDYKPTGDSFYIKLEGTSLIGINTKLAELTRYASKVKDEIEVDAARKSAIDLFATRDTKRISENDPTEWTDTFKKVDFTCTNKGFYFCLDSYTDINGVRVYNPMGTLDRSIILGLPKNHTQIFVEGDILISLIRYIEMNFTRLEISEVNRHIIFGNFPHLFIILEKYKTAR